MALGHRCLYYSTHAFCRHPLIVRCWRTQPVVKVTTSSTLNVSNLISQPIGRAQIPQVSKIRVGCIAQPMILFFSSLVSQREFGQVCRSLATLQKLGTPCLTQRPSFTLTLLHPSAEQLPRAPCRTHTPRATTLVVQPLNAQCTLAVCALQTPKFDRALVVHPGAEQTPFAPCLKQTPRRCALVLHPATLHLSTPPCFEHNPLFWALEEHPGVAQPFVRLCKTQPQPTRVQA